MHYCFGCFEEDQWDEIGKGKRLLDENSEIAKFLRNNPSISIENHWYQSKIDLNLIIWGRLFQLYLLSDKNLQPKSKNASSTTKQMDINPTNKR